MAAQDRDIEYYREVIGKGRVRALLEVIEEVRRRREEGQGSSCPLIQQGRTGVTNIVRSLVQR